MITELYTDLEQLDYRRKEDKRKLEEEIRKLEEKIYIPKETNETSKPSKDRKSYREQRKDPYQRSTKEPSPINKTYTGLFIRPRGETNSTLAESSHSFSQKKIPRSGKLTKRSQDQGSINKAYTTIKVYVRLRSMTLYVLLGTNPDDVLF